MAAKFFQKMVGLAKAETTYGTDPVMTGAADACLFKNLSLSPLEVAPQN